MFSLSTIFAVFLILIGVNICIYIGKKAYRTHVLLKNTASYILLQYGVGVLVVYLVYLEIMSALGIDARPSITRELVLWSALTVTTATISYVISQLAVGPGDGMLYHVHNVLLHRIVDGTRPEAWRSTMRQFEYELSKATKYQVCGRMLPQCLQYNSSGDLMRKSSEVGLELSRRSSTSDVVRRINSASDDVLKRASSELSLKKSVFSVGEAINSKLAMLIPLACALCETVVATLPVVLEAVATTLKHFWIRLSGIRITFGSVEEYYKDMHVDKRARIPNRSVAPLTKTKNQLNLTEMYSPTDDVASYTALH